MILVSATRDILKAFDKGFEVVKNGLETAEAYNLGIMENVVANFSQKNSVDDFILATHLMEVMKKNLEEWTAIDNNFSDHHVISRCVSWPYLPSFFFEEIGESSANANSNVS